jgi:hypothetical protein
MAPRSCWLSAAGQFEGKAGADAFARVVPDVSSLPLNQLPGSIEAQDSAEESALAHIGRPTEATEDAVEFARLLNREHRRSQRP